MPQEAIVCYQQAVQARPNYAMAFGEFVLPCSHSSSGLLKLFSTLNATSESLYGLTCIIGMLFLECTSVLSFGKLSFNEFPFFLLLNNHYYYSSMKM